MAEDENRTRTKETGNARTVAITGAGGGIGSTVADEFQGRGWNLALFDSGRNVEDLRERFPRALLVTADLTEPSETESAVAAVHDRFGGIDALAHLAGGFQMNAVEEAGAGDYERMLSLNFRTLYTTVSAVLPGMRERGAGSILGIAAKQALEGGKKVTPYAASKGALVGYLRALRAEVERDGIGVGIVFPMGTIDTPENREAMPDANPDTWVAAEEMAAALAYLAERSYRGRVDEIRIEAVPPAA